MPCMTGAKLLDLDGVASTLGLAYTTVRNYHQAAARRRRANQVRPGDFPPPDDHFGRSPVWKASTIRHWRSNRPGQGAGGGRRPRQA